MGTTETHPDPSTLADLAATAERVAVLAARLAQDTRESAIRDVDTKSTVTDVVTAGDRAAEQLIRDRLAELRPGEPVLGEEAGGVEGAGLTWVVDPIDGTVNYLYGHPFYAVSVAVQRDGASLAGAVVEPLSGRRWRAALGQGAFLDGRRLSVNAPVSLETTLLATGFAYDRRRRVEHAQVVARLLGRVRDVRRGGSAALDLCGVAAGWVDGYAERGLNRWDWAAGALIAREAGARVVLPGEADEMGADIVFAAAPSIADELRAALVECGVGEYD
ncbi:inositol monophosphatase family protein [Actinokineospora sp. G85]|uniref:inositol monophosphatase family protein n=1 Tax=Actinokineospora sp. G85 TaxID=3406626 RepID=UPI003C72A02E